MNIPQKFWNAIVVAAYLLVAFLAVVSLKEIKSISYVGKDVPAINTISVSGSGDAVAVPDVATFSFTVTENAKTVADAQSKATDKINNALKAVRDAGVADKDVQTTSYSINPHYDYQNALCTANYCPPVRSVLSGYDVSQSVEVKVRDLAKAGSLFTSIGSLGVQNVGGLDFSVDDPDSVKAEARSKAIADAQNKAKELAKELGVSLGRVNSFYESNGPVPVYYGMGGAKAAMSDVATAPSPEIPAGEQKVTDNVTITYEID